MTSYVYRRVVEHLLAGRLNFPTDQITGALIRTDLENSVAAKTGTWSHNTLRWASTYLNTPGVLLTSGGTAPQAVTPTVAYPTGVGSGDIDEVQIHIPQLSWTYANNVEVDVFGIVFYKDTGDPATSPLLMVDFFGPVLFDSGYTFTYKEADGGLLRFPFPEED